MPKYEYSYQHVPGPRGTERTITYRRRKGSKGNWERVTTKKYVFTEARRKALAKARRAKRKK